jgi:formamidopyrimidine-DNA glycosylase
MPEIIEVKNYADFIKKNIIDQKLLNINIINGRYKKHGPFSHYNKFKNLLPLQIIDVKTKGKFMYIIFENNYYIGVTLGLSGGWFFQNKGTKKLIHGINPEMFSEEAKKVYINNAMKHLNIEFSFHSGSLYFYDQLSFGTIKIFENTEQINKKLSTIGLDIMNKDTTLEEFKNKICRKTNQNKEIGIVLLNQKLISGVGNYLRADSLWLSKISPFRKIKNINDNELKVLFHNIRLLTWSVYNYKKGIELEIIKKEDTLPIDYKKDFLVYGKDKDIYNNIITKEKLYEGSQIRYIYWVKKYQK